MEGKVSILIGNGFNYYIKDYLHSKKEHLEKEIESLEKEIEKVINLWNNFESLIRNNQEFIEEIIEKLHNSFILFSLVEPFRENDDLEECIKKLETEFHKGFIDKLWETIYHFIEQENDGFYKKLTQFLYKGTNNELIEINKLINNNNIGIYTTNYDGIAEIVLGYNGSNFNLRDGFRSCGNEPFTCFDKDTFIKEDIKTAKLIHLHGSYKFFALNAFTIYLYKEIKIKNEYIKKFIKKNQFNLEPILILNAPTLKESQIKKFLSLSQYLDIFEKDLEKTKILIIWGQSLQNDPHLEERIFKSYLTNNIKNKEIIIVDTDQNHRILNKKEEIEGKGIKLKYINPQDKDLTSLFKEMGILND